MPLIGATISMITENTADAGTTTDIEGYYRLENIPVGCQNFEISYIGYEPLTIPNVLVSAGKEVTM